MPHAVRLPALLLAAVLVLAGCGSEASPDSASTPTEPSPSAGTSSPAAASPTPAKKPPAGTAIDIVFKDGKVEPDGVQKKVKAGEPIHLHVVSDIEGELHVHTSPDQVIVYKAGTTNKTLEIERPGVVDIEDHHLGTLLVQLEVR